MSRDGKIDAGKADDIRAARETAHDNETFGEALSKAGFEPAKVGRKVVSQGKRRETLKKAASRIRTSKSSTQCNALFVQTDGKCWA